jgi:hypothetical protein
MMKIVVISMCSSYRGAIPTHRTMTSTMLNALDCLLFLTTYQLAQWIMIKNDQIAAVRAVVVEAVNGIEVWVWGNIWIGKLRNLSYSSAMQAGACRMGDDDEDVVP